MKKSKWVLACVCLAFASQLMLSSASAWQLQYAPLLTGWAQLVDTNNPLPEYPRPEVTELHQAIARNVAALIPDGATLQTGIGGIPDATLACLRRNVVEWAAGFGHDGDRADKWQFGG